MKNLLLDNLIKDLSQISSMHDNCLDDTLRLYGNKEYQYTNLEQAISKTISIDKTTTNSNIELTEEETNELFFKEEYDNQYEIPGTINSLLIESAHDIEI